MPKVNRKREDHRPLANKSNGRHGNWDMSQERNLTLTLINQRITFYLVFFAAVVGGALNAKQQLHMQLILSVGVVISLVMLMVIFRTEARLQIILNELLRDPDHPYTSTAVRVGISRRVQPLMAYAIPTLCFLILLVGAIASWSNHLKVSPAGAP